MKLRFVKGDFKQQYYSRYIKIAKDNLGVQDGTMLNGYFEIRKDNMKCKWLLFRCDKPIAEFYKLNSAKKVAQLIHNG